MWESEQREQVNHDRRRRESLRSIEQHVHSSHDLSPPMISSRSGLRDAFKDLSCRTDSREEHRSISSVEDSQHSPILLKLRQIRCDSICECRCHHQGQIRSPQSLSSVLGSLLVGYQSYPCLTEACSNSSCQRRSGQLNYTYAFPRWLLRRVLLINVAYSRSRGPELVLRMMNIRPDRDNIFRILEGEHVDESKVLSRLKNLIDLGAGSILDISPYGMTCLHVSSCHPIAQACTS